MIIEWTVEDKKSEAFTFALGFDNNDGEIFLSIVVEITHDVVRRVIRDSFPGSAHTSAKPLDVSLAATIRLQGNAKSRIFSEPDTDDLLVGRFNDSHLWRWGSQQVASKKEGKKHRVEHPNVWS